ncbi:MAG TPA: hypothetical protein VL486_01130 [Verrucomicrobiae bacterium]|nr:hypothetical protein [Verrucomicrobiae bacterium]
MHNTPRSWSFLPKAILVVALGLTTLISYTAVADVTTDPVGFITLSCVAGPNKTTVWGLGMTQLPEQKGVADILGSTLTDSSASFTNNQWNYSSAKPYELEVTSGPLAGYFDAITGTTAPGTITLAHSVTNSPGLSAQSYLIRPSWTLKTALGANGVASGFQGGSSASAADNINVWVPSGQSFAVYYYKTNAGSGGSGWRSSFNGATNQGDTPLYIDQGIAVLRAASTPTNILLVGAVKLGNTISPIVGHGTTFAGNVYPFAFTLANSQLWTGSSSTGVQGGSGSSAADNINIWDPVGQSYAVYYYKTNAGSGGSGWRSSFNGATNQGGTTIPLGGTAVILRLNASPFNWVMTQPFSN